MAHNGDIVVARTTVPLPVDGVTTVTAVRDLGDGWHETTFLRPLAAPAFDIPWLTSLANATAAPVLACGLVHGEAAYLRGAGAAGTWDAWLGGRNAAHHRARGRAALEGAPLTAHLLADATADLAREHLAAAAPAAAWAHAAGHPVTAASLAAALARDAADDTSPVAVRWNRILAALGWRVAMDADTLHHPS